MQMHQPMGTLDLASYKLYTHYGSHCRATYRSPECPSIGHMDLGLGMRVSMSMRLLCLSVGVSISVSFYLSVSLYSGLNLSLSLGLGLGMCLDLLLSHLMLSQKMAMNCQIMILNLILIQPSRCNHACSRSWISSTHRAQR